MVLKRPVTIARRGRILGEFSSGDLPSLIESGEILPDDNCYLEESNEWQTVGNHIQATITPQAREAREEAMEVSEPLTGPVLVLHLRGVTILGFTVLLALALLVAAGVWIRTLSLQLDESTKRVADLQIQVFNSANTGSAFDPKPQIPKVRSKVVGQASMRDPNGGKQLLTGFFIDLFDEKTLRDYVDSRSLDLAAYKQTSDQEILKRFLRDLPTPLRKTTTDASGLYEFDLPAEGRYVVYSSMTRDGLFGPEIVLWFLSFDTADPLNLPVNITDDTQSSRYEPEFLIRLGRPATASQK
jgi:hypothetical protein